MDNVKLIAEVRKRPLLWTHKRFDLGPKGTVLWAEVAQCVGRDVETCRAIWKNLSASYRNEEKRARLRKENDMRKGTYDPEKNYDSKWPLYKMLSFIRTGATSQTADSSENKDNADESMNICKSDESDESEIEAFTKGSDQELEEMDFLSSNETSRHESEDILSLHGDQSPKQPEHFKNIGIKEEPELQIDPEIYPVDSDESNNVPAQPNENIKKNRVVDRQKRKEPSIKSLLSKNTTDYNFLVGILPKMKEMSDLQNVQFRANMCRLALNILAPTILTEATRSIP